MLCLVRFYCQVVSDTDHRAYNILCDECIGYVFNSDAFVNDFTRREITFAICNSKRYCLTNHSFETVWLTSFRWSVRLTVLLLSEGTTILN